MGHVVENTSTFQTPETPPTRPLIFVVDDEPFVLDLLEICLKSTEFEARFFSDPIAALRAFESAQPKPALLLADFQMPGMNGLELIHRCKTGHPELKTISISGTLNVDEMDAYKARPDVFLPKPFYPSELLPLIHELMRRQLD